MRTETFERTMTNKSRKIFPLPTKTGSSSGWAECNCATSFLAGSKPASSKEASALRKRPDSLTGQRHFDTGRACSFASVSSVTQQAAWLDSCQAGLAREPKSLSRSHSRLSVCVCVRERERSLGQVKRPAELAMKLRNHVNVLPFRRKKGSQLDSAASQSVGADQMMLHGSSPVLARLYLIAPAESLLIIQHLTAQSSRFSQVSGCMG